MAFDGGAADTPKNEFVIVDGKDREDVGVEDCRLQEENFCVVDDDEFAFDSDVVS